MNLRDLLSTDTDEVRGPLTHYFYNPAHRQLFFTRNPNQEPPRGYGKWHLASTPDDPDEVLLQYRWAQEIKNPQPYYQA